MNANQQHSCSEISESNIQQKRDYLLIVFSTYKTESYTFTSMSFLASCEFLSSSSCCLNYREKKTLKHFYEQLLQLECFLLLHYICLLALYPSGFWSALHLSEHLEDCQPVCTHTCLTWPRTLASCQLHTNSTETSTSNTDRVNLYCATTQVESSQLVTAEGCPPPGQISIQCNIWKAVSQECPVMSQALRCDCTYLSEPCRLDLSPKAE